MKRQKVDIKKIIKKKIEARHQKLVFIDKTGAIKDSVKKPMNERNLLRVNLVMPSGNLTNLGSTDRVALRTGTFISEDVMNEIFEYSPPINKEKKVNDVNNLIFAITTYNRINFLKKTINTWYETINKKYSWTLIIADDNSTDGTFEYIQNLVLEGVKIYLIKNENRGIHHQ